MVAEDVEVEDSAEEEKVDKPNLKYWISQIKGAEKAASKSAKWTKASIDEYLKYEDKGPDDDCSDYPLWWASIKTLQPAIYARTPIPVSRKAFDDLEDNLARLGSLCQTRLAKYLMGACPYDRVQYATRDTFIHSGKTTARVYFESEAKTERVFYTAVQQQQPIQQPQPMPPPLPGQPPVAPPPPPPPITVFINDKGDQLPPEQMDQLQQDEEGKLFIEAQTTDVRVCLVPLHYKDVLHTPNARDPEEIDWMAYKNQMHKDDVLRRFGKEVAEAITYKSRDEEDSEARTTSTEGLLNKEFCDYWEIWDKRKKQVYWYVEGYNDDFVDTKPDPYELVGFFPCPPFMLGTVGPNSLYAIPDFAQLRPLIRQVDAMTDRIRRLIRAAKYAGLFDSEETGLDVLANMNLDAIFLGVKNLKQIVGDGGLEKLVLFFPVEKFLQGAEVLSQHLNQYEQKFYELYKIPDIIRGVSDPTETAAAQQLKGDYHAHGISQIQREFQRLNRDQLEIMIDLALKVFPENKLVDVCGVRYMEQEDQELWPQVLTLLKDDKERQLRIDIQTDSTITMNQTAEIEKLNYLAKNLFEGLNAVAAAAERNPDFAPVGLKMLTLVVQGTEKGEQVEQLIGQLADKMLEPPDPNAPPPPDYEMMKLQNEQQKLGAQQSKDAADIQFNQENLQLKAQETQTNAALKSRELDIAAQQLSLDSQIAGIKLQSDSAQQAFDQKIAALQMQLETYKVKLDETEKYMTEHRLQREFAASTLENRLKEESKPKPEKKKSSKKSIKIHRDENGEMIGVDVHDTHDDAGGMA